MWHDQSSKKKIETNERIRYKANCRNILSNSKILCQRKRLERSPESIFRNQKCINLFIYLRKDDIKLDSKTWKIIAEVYARNGRLETAFKMVDLVY